MSKKPSKKSDPPGEGKDDDKDKPSSSESNKRNGKAESLFRVAVETTVDFLDATVKSPVELTGQHINAVPTKRGLRGMMQEAQKFAENAKISDKAEKKRTDRIVDDTKKLGMAAFGVEPSSTQGGATTAPGVEEEEDKEDEVNELQDDEEEGEEEEEGDEEEEGEEQGETSTETLNTRDRPRGTRASKSRSKKKKKSKGNRSRQSSRRRFMPWKWKWWK